MNWPEATVGLHITDKFGRNEYLKCLFCILDKYGGETGIVLDKGHLQELPSTWAEELQIVDLGSYWEIRRNPQPNAVQIMYKITKVGIEELRIVLWLLLRANKNYVKIRKRTLKRVPDDWMSMLEIKDLGHSFMISLRQDESKGIITDPTAIEMP